MEPLNFVIFTCSTINSRYLFSKKPWNYVSLSPKGNNLTPDIFELAKIIKELRKASKAIKLTIIIGNTDPYYIYLQQFKNFPPKDRKIIWARFIRRWSLYKAALTKWIKRQGLKDFTIISWYEFEKSLEKSQGLNFEQDFNKIYWNINKYFKQEDLDWELRKLKTQFGKGKYFKDISAPNGQLLKDWVKRKFAEYCLQGLWIYQFIPNAVLIQNEKPTDLRSKMYQPLIKKKFKSSLPIVNFFGVDNNGYQ